MMLGCVIGFWALPFYSFWLLAVLAAGLIFAVPTIIMCGKALAIRRDPQIVVLRGCAITMLIVGVLLFAFISMVFYVAYQIFRSG